MGTIAITGVNGGIGSATRRRLEVGGHRVIGIDIADTEVVADLSTPDGRDAMVAGVADASGGALDGVVAGAGVSSEDAPFMISLNYFGAVATLDGLRPLLSKGTNPSAVAISSNSTTATLGGVVMSAVDACLDGDEAKARELIDPGYPGYPTAKLALARWVRRNAVTEEWIGAGIRLNTIAPGPIDTPMTAPIKEMVLELGNHYPVPIGRLGSAEEIANVLNFLLGEESTYIVGSMLFVDGGGDAFARADDWPLGRFE